MVSFFAAKEISIAASPEKWFVPPVNCLRLDVDVAYNERLNAFAFGGVVRNHEGQPLLAFGRLLVKPISVTKAELLAIDGGLRIARENEFQVQIISSDSLLAVQAVTCLEEDRSYVGSIATDVRYLLEQQGDINFIHVRRSANSVAHALAAFVIFSSSQFTWDPGNFPFWLNKLVMMDISISL
ncbi:uncharacterized protein [Henckelia pumila]|uniref:uncharacterized protein n=1 Tax=Henckelia pumila TaxID=405737 RepID=UPI003C6DF72F